MESASFCDAIRFIFLMMFPVFLSFRLLTNLIKNKTKKYPPIAGTVFHHLLNFPSLHDYMTDLAAKHKTYMILTPFTNEIYTSDPANVEYILKTNFKNFGKGPYNHLLLSDTFGDGIFTVDGDKWRQQRKLSSYEFSTKVLRDFSSSIFRKNAARLADVVSEAANSNQTIDIQDLFMKSTLDSISEVAFGVEVDSLGVSTEGSRFATAFDNANELTSFRYVDVLWRIKRFLNVGSEATLKRNIEIVDDFVYGLIKRKTGRCKNGASTDSTMNSNKVDLLSRFMKLENVDSKYVRDIILNFVIAGKDTTAATLSWFVYMLCKHPNVQRRTAEEIDSVVDVKSCVDFADLADRASDEVLAKMHYLHASLSETLRLYPAIPVDPKHCFSADTLPDGFSVRKGDIVAYQPYAMGRMKFIWGDDAETFRPERWLDENGIYQSESPFKFTAFQGGPRICIGREFAYRQMKIFSALLLGSFRFELAHTTTQVHYRTMITLQIHGGLPVRAIPKC